MESTTNTLTQRSSEERMIYNASMVSTRVEEQVKKTVGQYKVLRLNRI